MPSSSVAYTAASGTDVWEHLRPAITHAWLNRASGLEEFVSIIREDYGIVSTRQNGVSETFLVQPIRARKGTTLQKKRLVDETHRRSTPVNRNIVLPTVFRFQEFVLYSVDTFVSYSFPEPLDATAYQKARDLIHPRYTEDYSLVWQSIADLYQAAEGYFRGECFKKFFNTIQKAHLELKLLIGLPISQPRDFQRTCQHTMITRFWRICHRLLKLDSLWPQYQYSFLLDSLIEFESLVSWFHGPSHPFARLLQTIGRLEREYLPHVMRLGASRTVGVMAPRMDQRHRKLVFWAWTDFTHKT
ncbi:uncharacterized protein FTOL_00141 [Fusarium torulosum]|uniref:Uncharacterized protein n=1 Tax=Fusarium torulosum TaxID=33205 RepID=A0AAE8LXQ2_9HYPO|nr:uncharacterized protein FTOL_00141 [Fusarium torulosum]